MARQKPGHVDYDAGDFLIGVMGMPGFDIGVYWVICSLLLEGGKPVHTQDERIYRIIKSRRSQIDEAVDRLTIAAPGRSPKLIREGDLIINKRAVDEFAAADARVSRKRAEAVSDVSRSGTERVTSVSRSDPGIVENQGPAKSIPPKPIQTKQTNKERKKEEGSRPGDNSFPPSRSGSGPPKRPWSLEEKRAYGHRKVAEAIGDGGWLIVAEAAEGNIEAKATCKRIAKSIGMTWYDGMPAIPKPEPSSTGPPQHQQQANGGKMKARSG